MKFALFAFIFFAGCTDKDVEMSEVEPWKMWGNTQVLNVPQTTSLTSTQQTGQLINVRYARPETWSFFFMAKLIQTAHPDDDGTLQLQFNVTQGVGRSHATIDNFVLFRFEWTAGNFTTANPKFCSSAIAPARDDRSPTDFPDEIRELVAQDVQINVSASTSGVTYTDNVVTVEVSAFVSPKTHIRPEWFERIGKFRAGENKGF